MDDKLKKMDLRDDGFLEIVLKRVKDFDDYVFQQIQKDMYCLPCMRDPKFKSKLFYDTKGYTTLRTYLGSHCFMERELLAFLIYLFEGLVKANASKPVYMNLDYVYLSYDGGIIKFLVLPITITSWLFQKEQSKKFMYKLVESITTNHDYAAVGFLTQIVKQSDFGFPMLLQGLHDLKEKTQQKVSFLERILHLKKEETFYIKDVPKPGTQYSQVLTPAYQVQGSEQAYTSSLNSSVDESIQSATVILFQESVKGSYLVEQATNEVIPIHKDAFTIGRDKENDLCIPIASVSTHQACIKTNEGYFIEDLSSSNGTYVNEVRIKEIQLQKGDIIRIARKQYVFYEGEDQVEK